jgi:hypothetical protein
MDNAAKPPLFMITIRLTEPSVLNLKDQVADQVLDKLNFINSLGLNEDRMFATLSGDWSASDSALLLDHGVFTHLHFDTEDKFQSAKEMLNRDDRFELRQPRADKPVRPNTAYYSIGNV